MVGLYMAGVFMGGYQYDEVRGQFSGMDCSKNFFRAWPFSCIANG